MIADHTLCRPQLTSGLESKHTIDSSSLITFLLPCYCLASSSTDFLLCLFLTPPPLLHTNICPSSSPSTIIYFSLLLRGYPRTVIDALSGVPAHAIPVITGLRRRYINYSYQQIRSDRRRHSWYLTTSVSISSTVYSGVFMSTRWHMTFSCAGSSIFMLIPCMP